jgi:hypothetical protein
LDVDRVASSGAKALQQFPEGGIAAGVATWICLKPMRSGSQQNVGQTQLLEGLLLYGPSGAL